MDIRKVPIGINPPHEINVIIEVPLRSDPIKYEFDKESGAIFVDRFLYTTMFYPCNYGFVPHTLAADGDPIDVMVVGRMPVQPGAVLPVRPIGVLELEDEAGGGREDPGGAAAAHHPDLRQGPELARSARDRSRADPAFLRALQGPRAREVGAGRQLARPRGGPSADPREHRAGEPDVMPAAATRPFAGQPSWR